MDVLLSTAAIVALFALAVIAGEAATHAMDARDAARAELMRRYAAGDIDAEQPAASLRSFDEAA